MPVPTPPTRPALRARYDARRREVVATAAALFAERGYHGDLDQRAHRGDRPRRRRPLPLHREQGGAPDRDLRRAARAAAERRRGRSSPPRRRRSSSCARWSRAWVAHVVAHRNHMLVFAQERQAIEREPRWRRVRSPAQGLREDPRRRPRPRRGRRLDALRRPRLSLLALLGMVNYTPQWLRPQRPPLTRRDRRRATARWCSRALTAGVEIRTLLRGSAPTVPYKYD